MADKTDAVLKMMEMQFLTAKQTEDQRATVTNYLLIIMAALQGYIVQRGFDQPSLAVAFLMSVLGLYGVIVSAKYYERFRQATMRVGKLVDQLHQFHPDVGIWDAERDAKAQHEVNFPTLSKLRLYILWLSLHVGMVLAGVINIAVINWVWS